MDLGKATPAFRAAARHFVRLKLDTNTFAGNRAAARLVVARRTGYILLLDADGNETRRWRHPGNDRWAELTAALDRTRSERPAGRTGRELIEYLTRHKESALRGDVMIVQAKKVKGAKRMPFLLEALKHPAVRASAIEEIVRLGAAGAPALPWLIEQFKDPRASDRPAIAYAMAGLDKSGKRVVPVYRDVLRQIEPGDIKIPLAIVSALGRIAWRSPEGYALLTDLAKADAIEVRNNAKLVLDRIPKRPTR